MHAFDGAIIHQDAMVDIVDRMIGYGVGVVFLECSTVVRMYSLQECFVGGDEDGWINAEDAVGLV